MSQLSFQKGCPDGHNLNYPLTTLPPSEGSGLVSPMINTQSHGLPTPPEAGSAEHDAMAQEVLAVRALVENDVWPKEFFEKYHPRAGFSADELPQPLKDEMLSTSDPKGCANVVHMDSPLDMPLAVIKWLAKEAPAIKGDSSGHVDFVARIIRPLSEIGKRQGMEMISGFEAKYHFGYPRPEEYLNIPGSVITSYPEGCPGHPSYPAGHGSVAGVVSALAELFVLSKEQADVIFDCAYYWSQFRTLAGVHYAIDNLAGLMIGGLMAWDGDKFVESGWRNV